MRNFKIGFKSIEDDVIQIQSRSMSDPPLSDIDLKNKMSGLPLNEIVNFKLNFIYPLDCT